MTDDHDSTTAFAPGTEAQPLPTCFGLKAEECTADGLRRIVLEQVDLATWHARRVGAADEHVHGVRQATKRMRAVLRLVRDCLDEATYRKDNAILRDVARDLSEMRSATVRAETLEALVEWSAPLEASVAGLRGQLVIDVTTMRTVLHIEPLLIEDLVGRLHRVRASLDGWILPRELDPTTAGLGRTYRRGRRAMALAYADRSTDRFHEWRKRVKYLWHQMEVLTATWPESTSVIKSGLAELGKGLGVDHDLADLGSVVADSPVALLSPAEGSQLLEVIAGRRTELQTDLRPLAQRLYAQTPRQFVRDLTTRWEEWGSGAPPDVGLPTMPEVGSL
jgi:CHAD domain-containing protein